MKCLCNREPGSPLQRDNQDFTSSVLFYKQYFVYLVIMYPVSLCLRIQNTPRDFLKKTPFHEQQKTFKQEETKTSFWVNFVLSNFKMGWSGSHVNSFSLWRCKNNEEIDRTISCKSSTIEASSAEIRSCLSVSFQSTLFVD